MIEIKKDYDPNKIVRNLAKNYRLVPLLEKAIVNFDEGWTYTATEKPIDYGWHPSTHATMSVTELYEEASYPEKERVKHSASLLKIFAVGHFWHQYLQAVMVQDGLATLDDIERNVIKSWDTDPEDPARYHWVSGSADVCPWTDGEWTGGIDYKTMNAHQFKQEGFNEYFGTKYECQMNIYMWLFDQDEWMIFAINKDNGEFKEYYYERNQPLIDAILEKWKFVSLCLETDTKPTAKDDKLFVLPELFGPVA
jgi:hypothetical protein